MMDDFVVELLTTWNLENYIDTFRDAGVDTEIFYDLDDCMLDKLFPKNECGFQKKFIKRYEKWKKCKPSNSKNEDPPDEPNNNELSLQNELSLKIEQLEELNISSQINSSNPDSSHSINVDEISDVYLDTTSIRKKTVSELLASTIRGTIVHSKFKTKNIVDTRLLSDLIIEHEMEATNSYCITKTTFEGFNEEIYEIFSTPEKPIDKRLYYYPYSQGTKTEKAVNAGGLMYDKYLSIRKKLIENGAIKHNEILPGDIESTVLTLTQCNDILLLQSSDSPVENIRVAWDKTFSVRERCKDIQVYFSTYKCLRGADGHTLLVNDFNRVYTDAANKLNDQWNAVALKIVTYSKRTYKNHNFTSCDQLLTEAGKQGVLAFFCLCKKFITFSNKRKADESDESLETRSELTYNSFIFKTENEESFNVFRLKKQANENENRIIEPYVAVVGNILSEGTDKTEVYVVIQKQTFKVASRKVIDAIDILFKCYIILSIEFPASCRLIWNFLNQQFYEIERRNKKIYRRVSTFINDLNALPN